jgi:hypothetical protein
MRDYSRAEITGSKRRSGTNHIIATTRNRTSEIFGDTNAKPIAHS